MSSPNAPFVYAGSLAAASTVQRLIPANTETGSASSVIVKARAGNTGAIYLGNATTGGGTSGSGLTATTGFELTAGVGVAVNLTGAGGIYVIGPTLGDKYDILEV